MKEGQAHATTDLYISSSAPPLTASHPLRLLLASVFLSAAFTPVDGQPHSPSLARGLRQDGCR